MQKHKHMQKMKSNNTRPAFGENEFDTPARPIFLAMSKINYLTVTLTIFFRFFEILSVFLH